MISFYNAKFISGLFIISCYINTSILVRPLRSICGLLSRTKYSEYLFHASFLRLMTKTGLPRRTDDQTGNTVRQCFQTFSSAANPELKFIHAAISTLNNNAVVAILLPLTDGEGGGKGESPSPPHPPPLSPGRKKVWEKA